MINFFNIPELFLLVARVFDSGKLTRLILFFSGTALILIGLYGVIEDYIHNWKVEEYSSIAALLAGAAILLATYLVFVTIPHYQELRRIENVRQYYLGKPGGDIKDLTHNILEKSQEIVMGTGLLAENVRACMAEGVTREECSKKIPEARELLEHINNERITLQDYLNQLENHVRHSGKAPSSKINDIK